MAAPTNRAVAGALPRTVIPRHIARLAVALAAPRPDDVICDPCAGACELLAAAAESVRADFPAMSRDAQELDHFRARMFHCFGADKGRTRCSGEEALRSLGVEANNLSVDDVLARDLGEETALHTLVLTCLPFAGLREYADTAKGLLRVVRTKRTELLMLARALELLQVGGRAVAIVPASLLSGRTKAHLTVRSMLVESHQVEAVIGLPRALFKPHFEQPTAMLKFTRTDRGGTERIWYCDLTGDAMRAGETQEPHPAVESVEPRDQAGSADPDVDVSDVLAHWRAFQSGSLAELERERTAQSFCVPKAEIVAQGYDLSLGRYQVLAPAHAEPRRPHEILAELAGIEAEIFQGMKDLVGMLK